MADAKRCDRCKGYYDDNSKYKSEVQKEDCVTGMALVYGQQRRVERKVDLCDDCLTALDDFLEMRKSKKKK